MGISIFKEHALILNFKNYERGKWFFNKYGAKSAFWARLMGPVAWIVPFLTGVYRLPYEEFLMYNIPGAIIGIGQFLLLGYFLGTTYSVVIKTVRQYLTGTLILLVLILVVYLIFRKLREGKPLIPRSRS